MRTAAILACLPASVAALHATPALAQIAAPRGPLGLPEPQGGEAASAADPPAPAPTEEKAGPTPGAAALADPDAADAVAADDDDLDLADLGLAPSVPDANALQLYGFCDLTWFSLWDTTPIIPRTQSFVLGRLNLYLTKKMSPRLRSLVEVRLLVTPHGSVTMDGAYIDDRVSDPANNERSIAWGGISIERALVEYDILPRLSVRVGRLLTPYGIWNIEHGSPSIIGANRPFIIGEQFFPEHQTGIALRGSKSFGEALLEYQLTLSNGRNPYDAIRDPDLIPAVGGRAVVDLPLWGRARFGISAYGGRATDATSVTMGNSEYDELALGADLQWDRDGLHLQAELLTQQRAYLDGKRTPQFGGSFAPDRFAWGAYALVGYRFASWGNLMPYAMAEWYHAIDPLLFGHAHDYTLGLNLRPTPELTLKVEGIHVEFGEGGLYQNGTLDAVRAQTAWVF